MAPSYKVFVIAAFLSCHWAEGMYKYTFELTNDDPFEPCELKEFTFVDTIFDLSNLTYDRDENDNFVFSGTFKLKKDVGVLEMNVEGKKFQQGNWVPLVTVNKKDYCKFIISPEEGAEIIFASLEPKRCPFDTNTVYTLQPTVLKAEYNTPFAQAQGGMMIIAKFLNKEKNISSCTKILGEFH